MSEPVPPGLRALQADITRLRVDAVVNAANQTLLGGGGVDGAIHRAAGPELRRFCAGLGGCPAGEARISPGFDLPARHIIHTVGPVWRGGRQGEEALLAGCYRSSFALAQAHGVRTIAFPAISCGVYGFPKPLAARIAVAECSRALQAGGGPEAVLLVAFDAEMLELYEREIGRPGAAG